MAQHTRVLAVTVVVASTMAASARAQSEKRVIFLDAAQENVTCIAKDAASVSCSSLSDLFLDTQHAVEMRVDRRKFFTDYNVEIKGSVTIAQPRIRGIEEAAKLTLGAGALLSPPPAKGALPTVTPKTASDLFGLLLNESGAEQPYAQLEADFDEIVREANAIRANLAAFEKTAGRLTQSSGHACGVQAGDPDLTDVVRCLNEELAAESTGKWDTKQAMYSDENEFRKAIVRVNDQILVVKNLQKLLSQSNFSATTAAIDTDLTQLEKNVDAFTTSLEAASLASDLVRGLGEPVREKLRADRLRGFLRSQLKALGGDQPSPVLDDAELNDLVKSYRGLLNGPNGGFAAADVRIGRLDRQQPVWKSRVAALNVPSLRTQLSALQSRVQVDVVERVADINAVQSALLERVNDIYDRSSVEVPLVKVVDLSSYGSANVFGYAIRRTDGFARYTIPSAAPAGSGPTPASALPPSATAAAASGDDNHTGKSATVPGEIVANGTFELHQVDRAAVVAGFVFDHPFSTADGVEWKPHVLLGIQYYLRVRDVFPGRSKPAWGILGGVSLNTLDTFFAGLSFEPTPGFNFAGGLRISTGNHPKGAFGMLGLDVDIFRKVFGKVKGIGTASTQSGQ